MQLNPVTLNPTQEIRIELAEYPRRRGSSAVAAALLFVAALAWIAFALTVTPDNGADPLPSRLLSLLAIPMLFFSYKLGRRSRRQSHLLIGTEAVTLIDDWALRRPARIERSAIAAVAIDTGHDAGRARFRYERRGDLDQPLAREQGHLWAAGGHALLPKLAISPTPPNLALVFREPVRFESARQQRWSLLNLLFTHRGLASPPLTTVSRQRPVPGVLLSVASANDVQRALLVQGGKD